MKVKYEASFLKDLKRLKRATTKIQVTSIIEEVKSVKDISGIANVKKMKGHNSAFRLRVGEYRLGFYKENDLVIFSRFMHRKDIYDSFPH